MKQFWCLIFLIISISLSATDWDLFKTEKLADLKEIPGWCSSEKAEHMMDLIYETRPNICVEIGVFSGASIYPTAQALKFLKNGIVFAIDSWSKQECLKGYNASDSNYLWWSKIDQNELYEQFLELLRAHKLTLYCYPMRMTSQEAVSYFDDESISILHIDGNHSGESMLNDVQLYFPKVAKGGYIWLNDTDWPSAIQAIIFLSENAQWDAERSIQNNCYLFRKPIDD